MQANLQDLHGAIHERLMSQELPLMSSTDLFNVSSCRIWTFIKFQKETNEKEMLLFIVILCCQFDQ